MVWFSDWFSGCVSVDNNFCFGGWWVDKFNKIGFLKRLWENMGIEDTI